MTRPNVLHLIETFHQGGSERQAVQLVRLLHATGRFNLHVACLRDEGILRRDLDGLRLPPIEAFPLISFAHPTAVVRLAAFAALLRRRRIALLHTHDFYTDIFGMAAGVVAGVPVRIASRREADPGRTKAQRFVERRAFDGAHAVIVNAEAIRVNAARNEFANITVIAKAVGEARRRVQRRTGGPQCRLRQQRRAGCDRREPPPCGCSAVDGACPRLSRAGGPRAQSSGGLSYESR